MSEHLLEACKVECGRLLHSLLLIKSSDEFGANTFDNLVVLVNLFLKLCHVLVMTKELLRRKQI